MAPPPAASGVAPHPSASSPAMASGSSFSATWSCSRPFSRPMPFCLGRRRAGRRGMTCSTCATLRSRPHFLLASSFTCGLASHRSRCAQHDLVPACHGRHLRLRRSASSRSNGRSSRTSSYAAPGPTRSAFLSAFFTLVGCHGLHVSAGILWLLTMMAQVFAKGFRPDIQRRILCFALFWHALDIIWIAVFTVVYLLGSAQ